MKVKMDFDQTQQSVKNPAVSVEKNEAEPLTINFADKRYWPASLIPGVSLLQGTR